MKSIITRSICCDVILPITNYKRFIYLLNKASENPQWLRHSFVVITDGLSAEDEKTMHDWYYETRVTKPMPNVTIIKARHDIEGNISEQYASAIIAGDNPFVYFQNEKDELPINIDKSIYQLYYNDDVDIIMGKCETFLEDKTPIEVFPMTNINGEFLYDCATAMMLFPSYAHPLSAVMRKDVFLKEPYIQQGKPYHEFAYYSFALRCIQNEDVGIGYMPYTIKISNRLKEHAITMGPKLRQKLIEDAKLWVQEVTHQDSKEFQEEIISMLEKGEITTFKEIDARVEDYMDAKYRK